MKVNLNIDELEKVISKDCNIIDNLILDLKSINIRLRDKQYTQKLINDIAQAHQDLSQINVDFVFLTKCKVKGLDFEQSEKFRKTV